MFVVGFVFSLWVGGLTGFWGFFFSNILRSLVICFVFFAFHLNLLCLIQSIIESVSLSDRQTVSESVSGSESADQGVNESVSQ